MTKTADTFYYHDYSRSEEKRREQDTQFSEFYAERNSKACKSFCSRFPNLKNRLYHKVYLLSIPGFIIMPEADAIEWKNAIQTPYGEHYEQRALYALADKFGVDARELVQEIEDNLYSRKQYTYEDVGAIVESEVRPVRTLVFILIALLIMSAFVMYHYATAPHLF